MLLGRLPRHLRQPLGVPFDKVITGPPNANCQVWTAMR